MSEYDQNIPAVPMHLFHLTRRRQILHGLLLDWSLLLQVTLWSKVTFPHSIENRQMENQE